MSFINKSFGPCAPSLVQGPLNCTEAIQPCAQFGLCTHAKSVLLHRKGVANITITISPGHWIPTRYVFICASCVVGGHTACSTCSTVIYIHTVIASFEFHSDDSCSQPSLQSVSCFCGSRKFPNPTPFVLVIAVLLNAAVKLSLHIDQISHLPLAISLCNDIPFSWYLQRPQFRDSCGSNACWISYGKLYLDYFLIFFAIDVTWWDCHITTICLITMAYTSYNQQPCRHGSFSCSCPRFP